MIARSARGGFSRMQEGWSYEAIAQDERLSRERIRQIVAETPALREIDAVRDHARSQIARLDPALRLAAEKVAEGDLRASIACSRGLRGWTNINAGAPRGQRPTTWKSRGKGAIARSRRIIAPRTPTRRAGPRDRGGRQLPAIAPSGRPENPDSKFFRL
jgi:hypothetical protein